MQDEKEGEEMEVDEGSGGSKEGQDPYLMVHPNYVVEA